MDVITGLLLHFQTVDKTSQLYLTYSGLSDLSPLHLVSEGISESKIVNE